MFLISSNFHYYIHCLIFLHIIHIHFTCSPPVSFRVLSCHSFLCSPLLSTRHHDQTRHHQSRQSTQTTRPIRTADQKNARPKSPRDKSTGLHGSDGQQRQAFFTGGLMGNGNGWERMGELKLVGGEVRVAVTSDGGSFGGGSGRRRANRHEVFCPVQV